MLRKFCIINTCGREDCGNHQQDHDHGAYYLVQDVDPRIAELEKELKIARDEASDLRAFVDGIKRHVTAAAQMFGLSS